MFLRTIPEFSSPVNHNGMSTTTNVEIGKYTGSNGDHFHGIIDEVYIFKRVLSQETINQYVNSYNYETDNGWVTSKSITRPGNYDFTNINIAKIESNKSYINMSVINAYNNQTIPGYENRTESNIDISNITTDSIRLKAWFSGDGQNAPALDSWGVEWTAGNAWRDSFIGSGKVDLGNSTISGLRGDEHTLALWHFDEGQGNVLKDSSGNGNDGTLMNMDENNWRDGISGKALGFDGLNDYITGNNNSQFLNSDDGTIEAWIKRPTGANPSVNMPIFGKHQCSKGGWYLMINTDNQIDHSYYNVNEMGWHSLTTSDLTWNPDQWYHIVGTRGKDGLKIYRDNILVASNADTAPFVEYGNGYMQIVTYGTFCDGAKFDGIIDEVCISDIARTPDEIRQVYQAGIAIRGGQAQLSSEEYIPGADPSCVGYWSFDEGSGDTAFDRSGNGNDGTLKNMDAEDWVDGVRGKALEFDGEDDYVFTSQSPNLNKITIEAWVNAISFGVRNTIVSTTDDSATKGYQIHHNSNKFALRLTDSSTYIDGGSGDAKWDTTVSTGNWYHIAISWDGTTNAENIKFYLNGEVDGTSTATKTISSIFPTSYNIYIGKKPGGSNYWEGVIDEVAIYNRALSPSEISAHYNFAGGRYVSNATLRSGPISLPSNNTWNTFHFNRTVPYNTYLNISIHAAATNETLATNESHNSTDEYVDLTSINALEHPSIYIKAYFQSNNSRTPVLYDWAVNWSPPEKPKLIAEIEDIIVHEDTPEVGILGLSDHFEDKYSELQLLRFNLEYDDANITLVINGSFLDIIRLAENFTGIIPVRIMYTNAYNKTTTSNVWYCP